MDLSILQWVVTLSASACLLIILILRRLDPEEPSIRLWITAVLLIALSNTLGALREVLPTAPALILSNTAGAMGAIYLAQGVRVLLRLPRGHQLQWLVGGFFAVESAWFLLVQHNAAVRMSLGSILGALVFGYCAVLFFKHHEEGLETVVRATGYLFIGIAVGYAMRGILIPFAHIPADYASTTNPVVAALYITSTIVWTMVTLLLALIVVSRVHLRLAAAKDAVDEANLLLLESTWLDPATQVTNRSRIGGLLTSGIESCSAFGVPMAVMLVSIEDSSRLGLDPRTVDQSMAEAAGALRTALSVQEPDFETLGRWGDDAFLVLLNGMTKAEALLVADRLSDALSIRKGNFDCFHIGVTVCLAADSTEGVLDRLYEATYEGSNTADPIRFR